MVVDSPSPSSAFRDGSIEGAGQLLAEQHRMSSARALSAKSSAEMLIMPGTRRAGGDRRADGRERRRFAGSER